MLKIRFSVGTETMWLGFGKDRVPGFVATETAGNVSGSSLSLGSHLASFPPLCRPDERDTSSELNANVSLCRLKSELTAVHTHLVCRSKLSQRWRHLDFHDSFQRERKFCCQDGEFEGPAGCWRFKLCKGPPGLRNTLKTCDVLVSTSLNALLFQTALIMICRCDWSREADVWSKQVNY